MAFMHWMRQQQRIITTIATVISKRKLNHVTQGKLGERFSEVLGR